MLARTWPDWHGETAVIVATGPSAASAPLEDIRGKAKVIAIKSSWQLVPWADVLYGVDRPWWIANNGAPEFRGLKVSPSPKACNLFGCSLVELRPRAQIITGRIGVLGCGSNKGGGHSGFQAINLAIQFGASRIVLVGYDMTLERGAHWHKEGHGVAKADADRVKRWREDMDACAPQFQALGVTVINATPESALRNYRKHPLSNALWE